MNFAKTSQFNSIAFLLIFRDKSWVLYRKNTKRWMHKKQNTYEKQLFESIWLENAFPQLQKRLSSFLAILNLSQVNKYTPTKISTFPPRTIQATRKTNAHRESARRDRPISTKIPRQLVYVGEEVLRRRFPVRQVSLLRIIN